MHKAKTNLNLSAAEYRGELVKIGYTVSAWSRKHGYSVSTVFEAIKGTRHGKLSRKIRNQLSKEIGIR